MVSKFFLIFSLIGLTACSTYQLRLQKTRQLLKGQQYSEAAASVQEKAFKEGDDQLIYLLDYALIQQYAGNYDESNKAFQLADQISEVKDYHSISRITGSLLLNESLVQYKGDAFEKILINAFGSINYLMMNNQESALIEVRRLNEKLRLYREEAKKDFGQNAFALYVSAMAWEEDGKYDDAYIDYEKVHKLAPHLDFVKKDLIRASIVSQRKEMTKKWKKEFSGVELGEQWKDRENGELVLLYQQGWGPRKRPNPVWLRVPKLYPLRSRTAKARLDITGAIGAETEKLFSVEQVAIQTLDDEYAGLIAKRIAGRVVKDTVANEIGKKNKGLGNLARLAMDIVDQADLRQWSTLPQSLQVARVYLKEGTYKVRVQGLTGAGVPSGESMPEKEIVIQKGKKTFLNWRSFY